MVTVKASQKTFTYAEIMSLTGICSEHLHNLAKRHRSGFFVRDAETTGNQTDRWFFGRWDLSWQGYSHAVRTKVRSS
jgi:hypothetical protein